MVIHSCVSFSPHCQKVGRKRNYLKSYWRTTPQALRATRFMLEVEICVRWCKTMFMVNCIQVASGNIYHLWHEPNCSTQLQGMFLFRLACWFSSRMDGGGWMPNSLQHYCIQGKNFNTTVVGVGQYNYPITSVLRTSLESESCMVATWEQISLYTETAPLIIANLEGLM